jgi:salicylate hydroxylase
MSTATEAPSKLKVAIIGGGIGGLCLAIGLLQQPHIDVQVYEAAHKFSEIGAGVAVGPNAQRALKLISPETERAFRSQATGNIGKGNKYAWSEIRYGSGPHAGELIGAPMNETGQQSVHRAKFLDELVKLVPSEIAHFGKRLTGIDEEEGKGVVLHFKDETSVTADCVIGADGVHSVVREHLLGSDHPALKPMFNKSVAYRGLVPMDQARSKLGVAPTETSTIYCGDGAMIMTYPIDFGNILNIVAIDQMVESWEGPWVQTADRQKIIDRFGNWGPIPKKIVEV